MWIWIVVTVSVMVVMLPCVLEIMRTSVSRRRQDFPGVLAHLPQGQVFYQWHGPVDGPVIVCVHGLSTPSFVWVSLIPELTKQGFRVLTYDHFGRGGSDRITAEQNGAFFARQFLDLLDNQGVLEPVHLVGYSMGGAVGAYIAAHHPERLNKVALIAPAGLGHELGGFSGFVVRSGWLGNWMQTVFYGQRLRHYISEETTRISPPDSRVYKQMMEETRSQGYAMAILSSLRHLLSGDISVEHRMIAESGLPLLAIWGEADDLIPLVGRDWLEKLNPGAQQIVMENVGHEIPYAYPKTLGAHLNTFFS